MSPCRGHSRRPRRCAPGSRAAPAARRAASVHFIVTRSQVSGLRSGVPAPRPASQQLFRHLGELLKHASIESATMLLCAWTPLANGVPVFGCAAHRHPRIPCRRRLSDAGNPLRPPECRPRAPRPEHGAPCSTPPNSGGCAYRTLPVQPPIQAGAPCWARLADAERAELRHTVALHTVLPPYEHPTLRARGAGAAGGRGARGAAAAGGALRGAPGGRRRRRGRAARRGRGRARARRTRPRGCFARAAGQRRARRRRGLAAAGALL